MEGGSAGSTKKLDLWRKLVAAIEDLKKAAATRIDELKQADAVAAAGWPHFLIRSREGLVAKFAGVETRGLGKEGKQTMVRYGEETAKSCGNLPSNSAKRPPSTQALTKITRRHCRTPGVGQRSRDGMMQRSRSSQSCTQTSAAVGR